MSSVKAQLTQEKRLTMKAISFLLLGAALIYQTHRDVALENRLPFIPPPKEIRLFHFGYAETMADVLWIRVLQDFFVCDRPLDHFAATPKGVCENSWVFNMLDLITDLAPKFGMPYFYGATVLSVITNDREGARIIYEKGLKELPQAWDIAYRAAYHYLIELKNKERAAELLVQAGKNGAPGWVFSLAGRLYSEEGQAFLAKSVLSSALEAQLKASKPDEIAIYKIRRRLEQIEEQLRTGANQKNNQDASRVSPSKTGNLKKGP
jgi:hypothetical protein